MTSVPDYDRIPSSADTTGVTVVALFHNLGRAEAAVRALKEAGFTDQEIGVVMQDQEKPGRKREDSDVRHAVSAGAVTGGLVGGLLGLLGSLLIPGLGPLLLGGVLASTLTAAGLGAATGSLASMLMELGVAESHAEHFERGVRAGGILLTVNAGERTPHALSIIERHGADFGPAGAL